MTVPLTPLEQVVGALWSEPHTPYWYGLETFSCHILHAHNYYVNINSQFATDSLFVVFIMIVVINSGFRG